MMKKAVIFIFFISLITSSFAQEVLTYSQFIEWVRANHPLTKQADLFLDLGRQELRRARGGFDPLIYGDVSEKEYNSIQYYNRRQGGISIPTMAGVEFNGFYEQNSGTYLNPERNVPQQGLLGAGAALNLGQGLFIDSRRAALRKAQIYVESTSVERIQMLNNLFLEANRSYWNWSAFYKNKEILEEGVKLAEIRFQGIRDSYILGDLPAIDTVEAYTQVLNRKYRLEAANFDYFNALQQLNVFLWDESDQPFYLSETTIPQDINSDFVLNTDAETLWLALENHPEIRLLDFNLADLEIERRLRADQLKPTIKLKYNLLAPTFDQFQYLPILENNYNFGISFKTPLFLRRERGALGVVKARICMSTYDRDLRAVRLEANLKRDIAQFENFKNQYSLFFANVDNLDLLLKGELIRFEIGESSLFLINAREVSLIDSRLILNDIAAKRNIAYARMLNSAGLGFDE
jgi:outer membrane protein TolC